MKLLAISVLIGALVLFSVNLLLTEHASAQSGYSDDMQGLLNRLSDRMNTERGFRFFIDFAHPLLLDQTTWEIGDPADKSGRRVIEVGKDYVCFQEIGGAADGRRCTPFSNIVSIFYLNN